MKHHIPLILLAVFLAPGVLFAEDEPPEKRVIDGNYRFDPAELPAARGLLWLSRHQDTNGGWNFDHRSAPECKEKCNDPGTAKTDSNGATALGILPYLGCGITHKQGYAKYKKVVYKGLQFLIGRQKEDGSFREEEAGTLSHTLATLCVAEAYGMTRDQTLKDPAQKAIDFIAKSQNPDGGWGDGPEKPSNTVITAWQLMALKSGYMAYLKVPKETAANAMKYLDSVQKDDGARYMLAPGDDEPDAAATAAGLLCRMYYGLRDDNPALKSGVEWLSETGVSKTDLAFNYFATQALCHYDDDKLWKKWHAALKDHLAETQVSDKESHEFGSWYNKDAKITGLEGGGRLAQTAVSIMTLEVYYRHAPIYRI